ncbi:Rha family transcriptional regulator, partial [Fangia hongkongensis]
MDINTLVSINHSQPVTTSLIVAETFNKRHTHVLDKINSLDCSSDFASANFSAHAEKIKAGAVFRNSKVYTITKDGFMFLVMGFTGKKAAAIKEKYIEAFNAMAKRLQEIEQEELQTKLKAQQDKIKKLESSSYTRNTVSPPQMQHIQQICKVNVGYGKAHDTHKSFYDWLHDRYQINKYDQMTQCQCLDLCKLVDDSPYDYDYSPNELEKLIKVNDKPLFKPKRIISYEYLLSGET